MDSIPFLQAAIFTPANRSQVNWIVVHDMEAPLIPGKALQVAQWFAGPDSPEASAHYEIDADQIVQSVREQDVAWQVQSRNDVGNNFGIGIEHAGFAAWSPDDWVSPAAEAMLQRSAALTADIASRWSIPLVWVDAAGLQRGERGITSHREVSNGLNGGVGHQDPGPGFPIDHYLDLVQGAASPAWVKPVAVVAGGLALGAFGHYLYVNRQHLLPQPARVARRRYA